LSVVEVVGSPCRVPVAVAVDMRMEFLQGYQHHMP
jgi:hypothetical protein